MVTVFFHCFSFLTSIDFVYNHFVGIRNEGYVFLFFYLGRISLKLLVRGKEVKTVPSQKDKGFERRCSIFMVWKYKSISIDSP